MATPTSKKPTTRVPAVIEQDMPDVALATSEGTQLQTFVAGLRVFFARAGELETRATQTLARARTWQLPTSKAEDEALVAQVRQVNADKREIEDHWGVTALVSRFHRRLTAARERGIAPLDDATGIGNRLHNSYAEAEKRRAREEEERIRREEERRAQEARDRELADWEAKALTAEAASPDLSERETQFVDYYTGPYASNAARAAQQAGFKHHDQAAAKLLTTLKIQAALEARRTALALRDQAAATREAPLPVEYHAVPAEVARGGTTTWSAEVYDADSFMAALLDPKTRTMLGIPADIATYLPAKLHEYARGLHEQIDRWPGVRHKKTTSIR